MKNLFQLLITLALFALLLVGKLNAQFYDGSGTEADPYQITSREDLEELADSVANSPFNNNITGINWSRNKYFTLMNDINDSIKFCIGEYKIFDYFKAFQGNFDGNNKKITLALAFTSDTFPTFSLIWGTGLFGCIHNGIIANLVVDGYVNINGIYDLYTGGICGYADSSDIINCVNYCKISGSAHIGGICGFNNEGNISNCINYGNIEADYGVGGICGVLVASYHASGNGHYNLLNCINYGDITGKSDFFNYVGGIAGSCDGINVSNCKNMGNIKGNEIVGGIIGCFIGDYNGLLLKLSYCENSGNVSGVFSVGGIAGHSHDNTEYSYCINVGTIRGDSLVGGIVSGYDIQFKEKNGNIYNSINAGLVIGKEIVGGIIGRCLGEVKNCINTGVVKGNTKWGCIVGENNGGTIINCHYDKQICGGGE